MLKDTFCPLGVLHTLWDFPKVCFLAFTPAKATHSFKICAKVLAKSGFRIDQSNHRRQFELTLFFRTDYD